MCIALCTCVHVADKLPVSGGDGTAAEDELVQLCETACTVSPVLEKCKKLKKIFKQLVLSTCSGIIRKGLDVDEVVDKIVDVTGSNEEGKLYLTPLVHSLRRSKYVDTVFNGVQQHWDYLHPEIYGNLIQEIPLPDLEPVQTKYQTALDRFLDQTPASEIQDVVEERKGEPPQGFTVCVTKHAWNPKSKLLRDIENLRRELALCCGLQSYAVTFVGVRKGCTVVTFHMPRSNQLHAASNDDFLEENCVISITFKGTVVMYAGVRSLVILSIIIYSVLSGYFND